MDKEPKSHLRIVKSPKIVRRDAMLHLIIKEELEQIEKDLLNPELDSKSKKEKLARKEEIVEELNSNK